MVSSDDDNDDGNAPVFLLLISSLPLRRIGALWLLQDDCFICVILALQASGFQRSTSVVRRSTVAAYLLCMCTLITLLAL